MSFIFGKKSEELVSNSSPRMTHEEKSMFDLPFSKYMNGPGVPVNTDDDLPPLPDDGVVVPDPMPEPTPVEPVPTVDPTPEPAPIEPPDVVIPDPTPAPEPPPPPTPSGMEDIARILEQMTVMVEQMNIATMSRVDALETAVQNRAKDIRESFYKSHLDVIDVGKKLKQAMYEAELQDLDIQKRTLEILEATEDKSLERAVKIKSLNLFGE